ncbi:SMI1/KNR4 family protein [Rhodopirellula halodulae]|uniref:SMI1/KNR4 family protein n=1 Tax=Rhodopirellula halodulae TaxID=2894198 RepID=UPI001E41585E|nr:SMI1/KNR4 family protein [Rhodopirellula sp. JC737]MCC9657970.1 SMI1/KNR4 family protein [Rhodopirellula sp. JC737]
MSIRGITDANLPSWITANAGATDDDINALTTASPHQLANTYLSLLRTANGGEAEIAADGNSDESYLVLWASFEVIPFNADYELREYAPAFLAFGSNGGGELFAFDTRISGDSVFLLPAIGMSNDDGMLFADSMDAFARRIAAA